MSLTTRNYNFRNNTAGRKKNFVLEIENPNWVYGCSCVKGNVSVVFYGDGPVLL